MLNLPEISRGTIPHCNDSSSVNLIVASVSLLVQIEMLQGVIRRRCLPQSYSILWSLLELFKCSSSISSGKYAQLKVTDRLFKGRHGSICVNYKDLIECTSSLCTVIFG